VNYDPENESEVFYCDKCLSFANNSKLVESRSTLIVCPASIVHQWKTEIERHLHPDSQLKVLVYEGVKTRMIFPKTLADSDIVLTTYDVMRSDLYHVLADMPKRLRFDKKYKPMPTPLTAINWWRICLDECQMVESTTAKAAAMALHLSTVNRWCVSGTPIQRGLEDIYGLLLFLRREPYTEKIWWNRLLKVQSKLKYFPNQPATV
jgi:E3 ubiquitin-protein ligase SHPRH